MGCCPENSRKEKQVLPRLWLYTEKKIEYFFSERNGSDVQLVLRLYQISRSPFRGRRTTTPPTLRKCLAAPWQHCARKNGTQIAPSEEPYFPLVEAGFSLKSWADFTLILLPSLQSPLLILNPMEAWLHWLVALVCQQLGETDVRNRLSEVRKLSSQKNQFVNLNHLGMGKKNPECGE